MPCSSVWSTKAAEVEERHQADARPLREDRRRHSADANLERVSSARRSGDGTNVGDKVLVDQFADGEMVDVIGRSKGRGFAGTIKRHHFNRGPESHGSMNVRAPGSIGASAYPSRVIKGNRSSGHMGDARITIKGLTVARVDAENNC